MGDLCFPHSGVLFLASLARGSGVLLLVLGLDVVELRYLGMPSNYPSSKRVKRR